MYNLLIKYAPGAWETGEGDMEVGRFYGGLLEPEGVKIGNHDPSTLTPETLRRLEALPTLLMYEGGTPGGRSGVVRYGRMKNLARFGQMLTFDFEPDADQGFLDRETVMRFARHLMIGTANHTHWALKSGDIPPRLLREGRPTLRPRPREEVQAELEQARLEKEHALIAALEMEMARDGGAAPAPVVATSPDQAPPPSAEPSRVVSLIIGIETYNKMGGHGLSEVAFAEADARAFATCIETVYGARAETPVLLLNSEATHLTIRDQLRHVIRNLRPEDLFIFYYAGHGFHAADGNRLTAADTSAFDLKGTTLSVESVLFEPLRESECKRALGFIDACAVELPRDSRDVIANLDPAELDGFLASAEYRAVFLSCKPGEKSWSTPLLKHGIWTHYLITALSGKAPEAIRDGHITDTSLRDYLVGAVAKFLREETSISDHQTPQASVSATHSFSIRRASSPGPTAPLSAAGLGLRIKNPALEGRSAVALKRLPEWKSWHSIPEDDRPASRTFVERLAAPMVSDALQDVYKGVKQALGLSHRDLTLEEAGASGSLHADAFRFSIEGGLDPEDLRLCEIVRRLELRTSDPEIIARLDAVFGQVFEMVVAELDDEGSATFDDVVDLVEHLDRTLGGAHDEDRRSSRASYTSPDGTELTFDLTANRVSLGRGRKARISEVLARAQAQGASIASAGGTLTALPEGR